MISPFKLLRTRKRRAELGRLRRATPCLSVALLRLRPTTERLSIPRHHLLRRVQEGIRAWLCGSSQLYTPAQTTEALRSHAAGRTLGKGAAAWGSARYASTVYPATRAMAGDEERSRSACAAHICAVLDSMGDGKHAPLGIDWRARE